MAKTAYEVSDWLKYLSYSEIDFLKLLVRNLPKDATVINVGAGSGTSGLSFAEVRDEFRHDLKLVTIDIRRNSPYGGLVNEANVFGNAGREIPLQILGEGAVVSQQFPDNSVDFVFIDDDHTENGITIEIDAWLPKMKDGGIMAFHDYGSVVWPSVKQVVDEKLQRKARWVNTIDTIAAFQVRKGKS